MSEHDPKWLAYARTLVGIRETPGSANTPAIMKWAAGLKNYLGAAYNADSVPWCGLFAGTVMNQVGIRPPLIAIRASSWDQWGVGLAKPYLGAVVRFARTGGGHVAFLTGQSDTHFRVLGGNQSDCVCETWIARDRCVAIRWPAQQPLPTILAPSAKTGSISRSEA